MTELKTITVPEKVWGRLATEADHRGVTVEDVLVSAINNVIRPQDHRDTIVALVEAGFPDNVIASRTGQLVGRVAEIRRKAGLKPNRARWRPNVGAGVSGVESDPATR